MITYTRDEIRTSRLSSIYIYTPRVYTTTRVYIYTYVNRLVELHFEFTQFDDDQIFRKDSTAMEIRFCDHCLRVIPSHFINHFTSMWLRNILHSFTEYRVVHYNNLYFSRNRLYACYEIYIEFNVIPKPWRLSEL